MIKNDRTHKRVRPQECVKVVVQVLSQEENMSHSTRADKIRKLLRRKWMCRIEIAQALGVKDPRSLGGYMSALVNDGSVKRKKDLHPVRDQDVYYYRAV
jgi:predicted ArsR family transcriptional regulator